jgi:hypothetical protein
MFSQARLQCTHHVSIGAPCCQFHRLPLATVWVDPCRVCCTVRLVIGWKNQTHSASPH